MSSDDEELAALRAQRSARIGSGANQPTGSSYIRFQAKERAKYFVEEEPSRNGEERTTGAAIGPPRPGAAAARRAGADDNEDKDIEDDDDDGGEAETEAEAAERVAEEESLRLMLPLFFGSKEKKVVAPQKLHSAFKRTADELNGKPGKTSIKVGGPAAVFDVVVSSASLPTQTEAKAKASAAGGETFGPPRPPAATPTPVSPSDTLGPMPLTSVDSERRPKTAGALRAGEAGDTEDEDEDEGDDEKDADDGGAVDPYGLPVTHEAVMGTPHMRAVTCLDLDPACARIVTGSLDYKVHMYDFNGMKSDLKAFREIEPHDGHPVLSLSWGPSGDAFLAVTGASQAKIFDRDGRERGEFARGDMYIRDMRNTKGHVSSLTQGVWHPTDPFTALTASTDGTMRVWDTTHMVQKSVVKPMLAKPGRVAVTACAYGMEGRAMAAGVMDGTIQIWSVSGNFGRSAAVGQVGPPSLQMVERQSWTYVSRPNQAVRNGHAAGHEVTSLAFAEDGVTLASRALDETLKIWDLRNFTRPVRVFAGLPCAYASTRAIFAPKDQRLVITGTVHEPAAGDLKAMEGTLAFLDWTTGEVVRKVGMPGAVTAVAYPAKLNQIFVGIGSRKNGGVRVLYDTASSEKGVVTAVGRCPRAVAPLDYQPPLVIKTPHALPMFREDPGRKRQHDKDMRDPSKTKRPDLGSTAGVGRQGRLGTTGGTLLTQHLLKKRGKLVSVYEEMDPREAMLRHGDEATKEFSSWTSAYSKTQPERIFAQEEDEQGSDEDSDAE